MKTALIAGATGLIGSQLLELLLSDSNYSRVVAITRKKLEITNSKFNNIVCELRDMASIADIKADDIFCCLGTTMKKARSKEAFRAVDYDAPLLLAKISKEQGARNYLLVSALGADKNSPIFYNQVKSEVEEAIQQVGFNAFHIFRPSLLLGPRKEQRSGEEAGKVFDKLFGWLVPMKYRPIPSIKVAKAMLHFAKTDQQGNFIHESKEIQNF